MEAVGHAAGRGSRRPSTTSARGPHGACGTVLLRPARRLYGARHLRAIIGGELRRYAHATGALRDEEVLRETLGATSSLPARGARGARHAWLVQRARQERVRRRRVGALIWSGRRHTITITITTTRAVRPWARRWRNWSGASRTAARIRARRPWPNGRWTAPPPPSPRCSTPSASDVAAMRRAAHPLQASPLHPPSLFAPILGERAGRDRQARGRACRSASASCTISTRR